MDSIPKDQKKNRKPEETLARVADYLKELNLSPDVLESFPFQLSGGMRQRVVIAIALACDPKVLIADEPTTALDVTIQAQILDLMRDLQKKIKTSIIIITHNLGVVANIADRVAVMYGGKLVETGDVEDISTTHVTNIQKAFFVLFQKHTKKAVSFRQFRELLRILWSLRLDVLLRQDVRRQ